MLEDPNSRPKTKGNIMVIPGLKGTPANQGNLTGKGEHEGPRPVPRVCVISLLAPVDVHAQPRRRDGRAPQLFLPKFRESLQKVREPLGAEVVLGRRPHLHTKSTGGNIQHCDKMSGDSMNPLASYRPNSVPLQLCGCEENYVQPQSFCRR